MLSTRKVKLHGMRDKRWVTKDKITQYKGLINLFKRDNKIMQVDTNIQKKKQKQELSLLHRGIEQDREALTNVIRGDRQQIRNVLQEHKRLQLAYQELQVMQIIENIHQDNFNKRKELDRLYHKMKNRTDTLIRLKLRVSELEDRLKYEPLGSSRLEILAKVVTAKVQNAILKQDAAISVRYIYKKILCIMKKDAIYFDAALNALQIDAGLQGKCMHRTVELGQLATEYLDDRKKEFKILEKVVQEGMAERIDEVKKISRKVNKAYEYLKLFMRKDSDITLALVNVNTNIDVQDEIDHVSRMLNTLKEAFLITDYNVLTNCIQEQSRQAQRLKDLKEKCLANRNTLEQKINHANCIYDNLYFTMVTTTFEYMNSKKLLKQQVEEQVGKQNDCQQKLKRNCNLMANIKSSLQHLEQFCKVVRDPNEPRTQKVTYQSSVQDHAEVINISSNVLELVDVLVRKLTLLATNAVPITDELQWDLARIKLQKLVGKRTKKAIVVLEDTISSPIIGEEIILEDPTVPTRTEIKIKSQQIVDANRLAHEQF
ncbi:hypothetical protein Trydic_g16830 [Trypoxylus dichotomus]